VRRARTITHPGGILSTAAAVSFSGIIGFVGLIVPHLARLLWGSDYHHLVRCRSGRASILLLADLLADTSGATGTAGWHHYSSGWGAVLPMGAATGW
jgi:iron complex transport system permease protein